MSALMTLGDYHTLALHLYGEDSKATKYFADKIAEQGPEEPVLADELQMLYLLHTLHFGRAACLTF